ncbi:SIR2 family protein [Pseudomonas sp. BF-RE-26]|uniref:SIR2 family protein n=1 Tax=Pseudomonas sp. BF-RE-26 TaxID=2832396 RepID=UPI001CBD472E|nr:SIR2 family protein [Pseudomonas sp. BF-RE-26]
MPNAGSISVRETLALLDGPFAGLAEGVSQGSYAFWLGSGISRERVIGLDGVLAKLIEFLRSHVTASESCTYRTALNTVIGLAGLSPEDRALIDPTVPSQDWPCLSTLVGGLWNQYSAVLSVEISDEPLDFLLWVGLDFARTFASQDADAEHLAIGMLALEGAVADLATANWDGLLEAAMEELGYSASAYQVTVTGSDLRGPPLAASLYKFHGCALRAIENEPDYRALLTARSSQIMRWMSNATFKIVRDQLEALIQRRRTLMIGMSAQDANIQHMFGQVGALRGWDWREAQTPIVFSAQSLANDHKTVLELTYGDDYEPNRQAICEAACLQAYAKPLLIALLLNVIAEKLYVLARDVVSPGLDVAARDVLVGGVIHFRNKIAIAGNGDRLDLTKKIASGLARARHQLQNGESPAGVPKYFPIDDQPAHLMRGKLGLAITGQREAAAALGLIGVEDSAAIWSATCDDPHDPCSGALRLSTPNSTARVFFAANDDAITSLMECGAFAEDDDDVVLICSRRVSSRQQRNPSSNLRTGKLGPRYIGFGPMLVDVADLDALRDAFRAEIGL